MSNARYLTPLIAALALLPAAADTFQEDFSTDPALHGWRQFGDTHLFSWNATNQQLQVTWDSSQTNSYFFLPLTNILTKADDFACAFDLRLFDISTNAKSGPFELAVGFFNLAQVMRPDFERGSGIDPVHGPRNLVEFDYFPAGYYAGYGPVDPTLSPTLVDADNNFASGFDLLALSTNDWFRVALSYSASNQTLHTVLSRNGSSYGPVDDVVLDSSFTNFFVDAFSISSYSDAGDDYDSLLAHGLVDNVTLTIPPPPVRNLTGAFSNRTWQVQFTSRTNWLYTIERTLDLTSWTPVAGPLAGTGGLLSVPDPDAPGGKGYYRVRAQRP